MRAPVGLQAVGAEPDGLLGLEQGQLGKAVEPEAFGGRQPVAPDDPRRAEQGQPVRQSSLSKAAASRAPPSAIRRVSPLRPMLQQGLRSITPSSPAATSITSTRSLIGAAPARSPPSTVTSQVGVGAP